MLEYKKAPPHIVLKFILTGIGTLVLLVLVVLSAQAAWHMYGKFAAASGAAAASEAELAHMQAQKESVSSSIEELSSPLGIEENMRERFGVAKPGEGEIRIVRKEGGEEGGSTGADQNIFIRIFNAIFVW